MAETMKVFVGNLAWSTTDEQLSAFMAPAGNIVSAEVQTHEDTGRSKGWGLVEYSTAAEAANAVATLNNMELEERTVHVRLDRSNIDTTSGFSVFVGNLPWSTTSEALAAVMAPFEPFDVHVKTNMAGRSRGFAVARFSTPEQAQAAIADLNGYDLEGRQIQVREDRDLGDQPPRERAPRRRNRGGGGGGGGGGAAAAPAPAAAAAPTGPRNVLFVGNLSWDTDDTALLAHFQGAAAPPQAAEVQVSATGRSKGWGLVTFAAAEDAQAAADALNRSELDGRQINVRMDRK